MRWRARLLNVIVIAPVAALAAASQGPVALAQSTSSPPAPIVIAIDPGHGGSANPDNPSQLFDPGAIATNGVEEKDVTLGVGQRLAALLEADSVRVVLTRNSDVYLTIPQREQMAIDNHAALFVSIHVNSFTDPSVGGALVLYPNVRALPFAQALSDALGRGLAAAHVATDGIQLRDNWWIHAPMPTSTVEMAYLTNAHESALMATATFREQVAAAIRDGIKKYDPDIAIRAAQIRAWRAKHPGTPVSKPAPAPRGAAAASVAPPHSVLATFIFWSVIVAGILAVLRWPKTAVWLVVSILTVVVRMAGSAIVHRSALRRRRRVLARQAARAAHSRSVYDELWL